MSEPQSAPLRICADICKRNGIPKLLWKADKSLIGQTDKQNMTVHRWFAAKACPGDYLYNLHSKIADEVNKLLVTASAPITVKTPIMGKAVCTAAQLNAYAKKNNPNAPEYGAIFIEEGAVEGVRGDIAFCQSCLETGFFKFGGDVSASQNNFCGLGAVGGGTKGASFATAREGVRAQIQHLKAYASAEPLKQPCLDPRFGLVTRGIAPNWEDLNGRWAVPGNGYGESIVKMWSVAKAVVEPTIPATSAEPSTIPATPAPSTDTPSDWATESWAWAKANGITDGTNPKGNITREQTACMIHRFSKLNN